MPRGCAIGCKPSKGSLHVFPNPNKFPERFKAWVRVVGGQDESHIDYKKLKICDRHFTERDRNRNNRLNALAVPSLFLQDPKNEKKSVPSPAEEEIQSDEELESDARSSDDDNMPMPSEPLTVDLHSAKICRVCLALDVKMFPLRDSELTIMFHTITGIQLEDNEGGNVGSLICWECAARLRAASTFRSKALLSDTLLQRLISKGEEIELEYFETVKEKADCLVPPKTLSATEITHIDIDQNETSELVQSDDDDQHSVLDNIETQESVMDENIQMDVEGDDNVAMITEIEETPIDKNPQKLPDLSNPFQSLTRSQEDCYDEMIKNFLESIKKSRLKVTRKRRKGAVLNDPSYCLKENSENEIKNKIFKTYGGSSKKFSSKKS